MNDEKKLDQAIEAIRNEAIDPVEESGAADRVWARLGESKVDSLRGCGDFQALIPAWRAKRLSPARMLLMEDHLHECVACRKAARGAAEPIVMRPRAPQPVWRWAMAACLLVAAAGAVYYLSGYFGLPNGVPATVYAAEGTLYRLAAGPATPLAPGAQIQAQDSVRTARGAHAVLKMRDGSLVELRERTELAFSDSRRGATIRLAAGNIIVQAAKQHAKHLYVATDDCLVAVKGTIFSVNHGIKGSRVAVVEGEVLVTQGDQTQTLHPGQQTMTSASLTPVSVEQEVAWSRNSAQYDALLGELAKFQKRLEAMPGPGLRYSTRLADLAPAGTVFYAAIPNLGPALTEAQRLFREQLAQSDVLRAWWTDKMSSTGEEAKLDEALARIEAFSSYLGPEVAVALVAGAPGSEPKPVLMAEVARTGLKQYIEQQLQALPPNNQVQVVSDPAALVPGADKGYVWVGDNLAVASNDAALVQAVAADHSPFTQSAFHGRIADAYKDGVAWLFSADLASMVARANDTEGLQRTGFADVQYLIVERKDVSGQTENRASVTFSQQRRGIASWLASPAELRALDYVSPAAQFVTAAAMKNPAGLLQDLTAMAAGSSNDFLQGLAEFEAKTGVSVKDDLAAPLGGEFAFAFDGPVLPVPSWKLAIEIYDPAKFQVALERLAAQAGPDLSIAKEVVNGRTFYRLTSPKNEAFEADYTYDNGFLIAAGSRDLVLRSIDLRNSGYSLARSDKFRALLPRDGHTNFSAVVYQNLGGILQSLSKLGTPEQQKAGAAAAAAGPSLVLAYGDPDRIELASVGSFFGLRLDQMLGKWSAHGAHAGH